MSKEYLDILSEVILHAEKTGMEFWIYDENGWPSGNADGQVITLYPSTYNAYVPYHHRNGDRHLVSPAQYTGEKNFADWEDAPECTLIPQRHFVKLGTGYAAF